MGIEVDRRATRYVQTTSGLRFHVARPLANEVDLGDVALGLSRIRRWCGQGKVVITDAQHSCEVARLVEILAIVRGCERGDIVEAKRAAMMHEAVEALGFGDPASPVKSECPDYCALHDAALERVFERFAIAWPMPAIVHECDVGVAHKEWQILFDEPVPPEFGPDPEPKRQLVSWSDALAYEIWLERWLALEAERAR
jgi:hypothetical protein